MTSYQARSQELLTNILTSSYYLNYLIRVAGPLVELQAKIAASTDEQLNSLWNAFWWSLPDSPVIRTGPFFKLCDLCEETPDDIEIEISEDNAPAF